MQFKREDIGLYVATALIGGGFGLLAGAFLAARIDKRREEDFNAAEAAQDESDESHPSDYYQEDLARQMTVLQDLEKEEETEEKLKRIKVAARGEVLVPNDKVAPARPVESHRLAKSDRDELARLTKQYAVNQFQIELVEKGTLSVDDLELTLIGAEIDSEDDEVTDYGRQYRGDDKPDMGDLLEKPIDDVPREINDLLVIVDDRWEILIAPPEGKSENKKRTLYFDPSDESVYMKTSNKGLVTADLRVIATPEVRDLIMPWLIFEEDLETIYLNDIRNKKTRWYEITRLKEDGDVTDQ